MATDLSALLAPIISELGYELWHLQAGADGQSDLLRVFIDSEQGIDLEDCEAVSREISATLAVEGHDYALEVSSPGVERPLITADHFSRFVGERAQVKCFAPVAGQRRLHGWISEVADNRVWLTQASETVEVELANVAKAYLDPEAWPDGPAH